MIDMIAQFLIAIRTTFFSIHSWSSKTLGGIESSFTYKIPLTLVTQIKWPKRASSLASLEEVLILGKGTQKLPIISKTFSQLVHSKL